MGKRQALPHSAKSSSRARTFTEPRPHTDPRSHASEPRPLNVTSGTESDDPLTLGRDLDRCARLLHQMLETDHAPSSRTKSRQKNKMCKKDEGRRQERKSAAKSQGKSQRTPLQAVENTQKPTLIITTPNDKHQNHEPATPLAPFNRRLSSSTPEPCKQFPPQEDQFPQFTQEPQWNMYYEQYHETMRQTSQAQTVLVTLPSSPVNYSVNHAPAITATHASSVHPTMTYTTPIPTTQQGGNSPPGGHYPSGYASYPGVYYSPVQYNQAGGPAHHSPPTRLSVDQDTFRSLASRHFQDGHQSHQSPPRDVRETSRDVTAEAPPSVYQSPPRPDSPRPLHVVDEAPELEDRAEVERTVHFEQPVRDEAWPPLSAEDAMQDSKLTFSTENMRNKMATLHYLLGELRVLADGDQEVSRLVGEVQTTVEEVSPLRSATSFQAEVEQALQPLRSENSQLRRRLRILNHQLKEREKKEKENVRPDTNFDVAHIQAKYESLQAKYSEEKEKTARLQRDVYRLEGQIEEVKTDRAKVVMQLSEKETEQMKIKHDWLHESTRLKKDLDSYAQRLDEVKQKLELVEREKHILQLTVQQRDTDLTRVQDLLHDAKNRYHSKSSPAPNLNLSPSSGPSRLTRQALEEFNNSPQNTAPSGHKSPIERLGLENPKTPGCSPKLSGKDSKYQSSERSREEKKSKRVKSPLGASLSSTPQKKHMTIATELDNSNISSVSRDTRCSSPTLVSTNVPSASQVDAKNAVMPTMPTMRSNSPVHMRPTSPLVRSKSPIMDSTISSVSTDASTITNTAITARYQPSNLGTALTMDSKFAAPSTLTQDSIFTTKDSTKLSSKIKHDESDRYSVSDYFHKYGSSAVERYQNSSAGSAGTTFMTADESKSDLSMMTNSSVSSINSQDDRSFRAGLANLDANIARLQMALRSTPR